MEVQDLYRWLERRGYNQLATDVNRAAGLYADAMADADAMASTAGDFTDEEVHGDGTEPKDVPDPGHG